MTTQYFEKLIEEAKKNKKLLQLLKEAAVKSQQFEFAAELRQIERENFPLTEEQIKAKELTDFLDVIFRGAEISAPKSTLWLIYNLVEGYKKKKQKFSLKDISALMAKQKEIFEE